MRGDRPALQHNRYEIEPMTPGARSTHWTSSNPVLGTLRGRFVLAGDAILSFYASPTGRYRGYECLQQRDDKRYSVRGAMMEEDKVISTGPDLPGWRQPSQFQVIIRTLSANRPPYGFHFIGDFPGGTASGPLKVSTTRSEMMSTRFWGSMFVTSAAKRTFAHSYQSCGLASRAKRHACAAPFRKRKAPRAIRWRIGEKHRMGSLNKKAKETP